MARLATPATRGTSISRALDFGVALFDERAFAPAKRIIDISGDGPNNIGPPVTLARDRAVARGITVNGLPILVRPSRGMTELDRYFEDCVIGGEGAFVLAVRSRAELALRRPPQADPGDQRRRPRAAAARLAADRRRTA